MKYSYLVVEGQQDLEVLTGLFRLAGFKRLKAIDKIPTLWHPQFPKNSINNADLLQRPRVPTVMQKDNEISVLISPAGGLAKIALENQLLALSLENGRKLTGFGVIIDTDPDKGTAAEIYAKIVEMFPGLSFAGKPGEIKAGNPNTGIFLLPDNCTTGSLETLLLDAAEVEFPKLKKAATSFVDSLDSTFAAPTDLKEFNKPFGRKKAIVGTMGSIFKPGKSIQVSIHDNPWLTEKTRSLPGLAALWHFLRQLTGIEHP